MPGANLITAGTHGHITAGTHYCMDTLLHGHMDTLLQGSVVHERVQKNAFIEHVHFYENDELNATS